MNLKTLFSVNCCVFYSECALVIHVITMVRYIVPVDTFIHTVPSPNSLCAMRDTIYRSLMSDLRMQSVPRASISSVVQVTCHTCHRPSWPGSWSRILTLTPDTHLSPAEVTPWSRATPPPHLSSPLLSPDQTCKPCLTIIFRMGVSAFNSFILIHHLYIY